MDKKKKKLPAPRDKASGCDHSKMERKKVKLPGVTRDIEIVRVTCSKCDKFIRWEDIK